MSCPEKLNLRCLISPCRFFLCLACPSSSAWSAPSGSSSRDTRQKLLAFSWEESSWFWSAGRLLALFWRSMVSFFYSGQFNSTNYALFWLVVYRGSPCLKWLPLSVYRGFFPVAVGFIRRVPVLGSLLSLPGISTVSLVWNNTTDWKIWK